MAPQEPAPEHGFTNEEMHSLAYFREKGRLPSKLRRGAMKLRQTLFRSAFQPAKPPDEHSLLSALRKEVGEVKKVSMEQAGDTLLRAIEGNLRADFAIHKEHLHPYLQGFLGVSPRLRRLDFRRLMREYFRQDHLPFSDAITKRLRGYQKERVLAALKSHFHYFPAEDGIYFVLKRKRVKGEFLQHNEPRQ